MLNIEYVRNLNCNYERILLNKMPDEKKYQYCILSRGEVRGLLPCSLRYINGLTYLYYDISSRQNIQHRYSNRCITREWIQNYVWSLRQIQQELGRFLLDIKNILWYPEHIFQEPESGVFSFLYVPYYQGEESFAKLVEFWVEHIDYSDEELVDCVYHMYERMERNGEAYLQSQIFEDAECLENRKTQELVCAVMEESVTEEAKETITAAARIETQENSETPERARKSFGNIFRGKRNRDKKLREDYKQLMQKSMAGYAVAEETEFETGAYGKTVFIEEKTETAERMHRLFAADGKLLVNLEQPVLSIGKKEGEAELILKDASVSRIHARITVEKGGVYLEDLNSTNGTFRNDIQMLPYEKLKLEEGDEIKCGKVPLIFR